MGQGEYSTSAFMDRNVPSSNSGEACHPTKDAQLWHAVFLYKYGESMFLITVHAG